MTDDPIAAHAAPNPIDRQVGLRIRMRRKELGISQEKLAEALGLTFQQVQKYERAANRVSASKLFEIARALQAPPSYFFDGLADLPEPGSSGCGLSAAQRDFLISPEGIEFARMFPKIPRRQRQKVVELVRALVSEPPTAQIPEAAE